MKRNYLKGAQPHEGVYYMHPNEILTNVTAYLKNWAEDYIPVYRKEIQQYFYDDINESH